MFQRRLPWFAACLSVLLHPACGSSSDAPEPGPGHDAGADGVALEAGEAGPGDASEAGEAASPGMSIGEVKEFAAGSDGTLRVELPTTSADESYIAILHSAAWETEMEYGYALGGAALQARVPRPATARSAGELLLARAHAPWRFASSLPPAPPRPAPVPGAPPQSGEHKTFKVMNANWTKVLDIDAECIKVGSSLAIWVDRTTTDPVAASVDPAKLDAIVTGFETTVLPRHRTFFGQESDVDQDGLIHVLYTPIFSATGVVAYFSACDLATIPGCAADNNMELIYATPPDQISSPMMSSVSSILETLAHEVQHAIYFHRKNLLNSQPLAGENPYVLEALAGLGEDLSGYGNGTFYVWASALDLISDVSAPDLLDGSIYNYIPSRDGALRGAGYLLYRYLYDQAGANSFAKGNAITDQGGVTWLRALCDSPELGAENLEKLSNRTMAELVFDWYTALAVSNRPGITNTEPRFKYLPVTWDPDTKSSTNKDERHGVDLFSPNPMNPGTNLSGPAVTEAAEADGLIRAGGVEYLRFAGGAGGTLQLTIAPDAPGANLKLRLLRER